MKREEYKEDGCVEDKQANPIQDEMEIIKLIMLNFTDKCKRFYF